MINDFLLSVIPEELHSYTTDKVSQNLKVFGAAVLIELIYLAFLILLTLFLRKLNKKVFEYLRKKRGKKTHLVFLEGVINALIIIVAIIIPVAGDSLRTSILGSAAVLTAVVGFAGQDIIKDLLAGFLISIYKPFDIGDRIALEDGTVGIVESITMHHVVIVRIDTLRVVIPNSKINNVSVVNYSFDYVDRSELFKFPVGYDSNIEKVKEVIGEAVIGSPYSEPGKRNKDGEMYYTPVYFLELADSALIMAVTVYYRPSTPTEVVKDDINTRVFKALEEAGIEIPYAYTNVVVRKETETA